MCDRCNETKNLVKWKGCIVCLSCGYKSDCNGY